MASPTHTIDVDTTRLNELCFDLQEALIGAGKGGDAADVVRDETRRLAIQIAKFTPPQTRQIGELAIEKELKGLFSEATTELIDTVGEAHGLYGIDTWITKKDGTKQRLRWEILDPTGSRLKERHLAALNRYGKVPKPPRDVEGQWRARVVVPKGTRDPYIAQVQKRVGRWKASWAQVASDLGVANIAGWIKRHLPTPKGISETGGLMDGGFPRVTFGSRAPNAKRQLDKIQSAVRVRREAMAKRIKLIVSGYSKDIARGMRVKARANRTNHGGNYAIR